MSNRWHERKRSNFAVSFFRHNGYFRLRKAQKRCGRWTQIIYIKQHFYTKYSENRISKRFLWNRNKREEPQGFYQPWGSYLAPPVGLEPRPFATSIQYRRLKWRLISLCCGTALRAPLIRRRRRSLLDSLRPQAARRLVGSLAFA